MKQIIKKITAGVLTASLAFSMAVSGSTGKAQAAADKALISSWELTAGEKAETGNTRFFFDGGNPAAQYACSASVYIPKAALAVKKEPPAMVNIYTGFDLYSAAEGDNYMGHIDARYSIALENNLQNGITLRVYDELKNEDVTDYSGIAAFIEAGDFYKVDIKNNPSLNVLNLDDGTDAVKPLEEVQGANNFAMNLIVTGLFNKSLFSIIYVDDISIKADGVEVVNEARFADPDYYYDRVLNDKDETVIERPALADLNTSLLKLAKSSASIKVGKKVSIQAAAPGNAKITYKSSDKKIATVTAKGVVKGKKAGTAKITVSANGVSKTFKVKVKKK